MNIPDNDKKNITIPDQAKGNPVYEQTREDMPLWCCGTNCGRNSRIVVFVLAAIGIACSTFVCLSHKYFQFEALRNDTFYEEEKAQPEPFQFATKANVGIFKYEVLEVFEYPWPPKNRERMLADQLLKDELHRMAQAETQEPTPLLDSTGPNGTAAEFTFAPVEALDPTASPTEFNGTATEVPDILPGSNELVSQAPTGAPSSAPTPTNPNDIVAETTPIGEVLKYPKKMQQFDAIFANAQKGAMVAPILAGLGIIFGLIEFCCCTYKCSWLPTALFLYFAFMMQMMTLFLFLSEDFCKYEQDCKLGIAGFMSCIALFCYMIANTLVCCTPRPNPIFNCCKKPPVRRKKKKKKKRNEDDPEGDTNRGMGDEFQDEDGYRDDEAYYDPNDQQQDEDYDDDYYGDEDYGDDYAEGDYEEDETDPYYRDYDNDTYANDDYAGDYGNQQNSFYDNQGYDNTDDYGGYDDNTQYSDKRYT